MNGFLSSHPPLSPSPYLPLLDRAAVAQWVMVLSGSRDTESVCGQHHPWVSQTAAHYTMGRILSGQLYFSGGRGKKESEEHVRTQWTAICARLRNVWGSNLIGAFRSSMWPLHSSCIRSIYWFVYNVAMLVSSIYYVHDWLRLCSFSSHWKKIAAECGQASLPTDTASGYTCETTLSRFSLVLKTPSVTTIQQRLRTSCTNSMWRSWAG